MRIKFYQSILLLVFAVTVILTSCQKDDNSQSQLNVTVVADSTSFNVNGLTGTPPGNISFTAGFLTVNTFKFNALIEKVPKESVTNGPLLINLFTANPNVYVLPLERGYYTAAQVKVSLIKSTGTAPLILVGKYTNAAGVTSPIEFDLNENTDIILKIKDQLITDQFTGYTLYMRLFLNKLFGNIAQSDLDKATKTNTSILITSALNKTIYAKLKVNLLTSLGGDVSEVDVNDN